MSPLANLMLVAILLVVVLALLLWALVMPRSRPSEREQKEPVPRREPTFSNDDVRGAKALAKRQPVPDDAFERFLGAGQGDEPGGRDS